ncbi:MAG TPA: 4-alpha-glucanotransferase [Elusimicrobia bacterium]|nr:MAG: 4-alpha-glucanotransferase [Elusimicrobia bacterium GWF2_62_30]HBA60210.1 4-alpha-glucanotransferase [Elusimicrobiota bacterium]
MHPLLEKKLTGTLFPLFSMRSKTDWGIGDTSSMMFWFDAMKAMNLNLLQVLPINEMPPGVSCPYTALSAFALDPVYIDVDDLPELKEFPDLLEEINSRRFQAGIKQLRIAKAVMYNEVRHLKFSTLWKIYTRFHEHHVLKDSKLATEFRAFCRANAAWLEDYAAFRRLKDTHSWTSWTHWEAPLKERAPQALQGLHAHEEHQVLFFKYLQWCIHRQWTAARARAAKLDIKILGDLPFMVNQESSDVWARQNEFLLDREVGAPPDAFSETGQRWGLPAYNWPAVEANEFDWWRTKVKKASEFYDLFRIDHMVGFFRTWVIPRDVAQKPDFDIKDDLGARERGRRFLKAVSSASPMLPVAEDLGLIPPYVTEVLADLKVPGYKVMRWEKNKAGTEYLDPAKYPAVSLATSSTHDNEPLADWWDTVELPEKKLFWKLISGEETKPPVYSKAREKALGALLSSGSRIVILPIQDIVGSRDRVNIPGTLGDHNWTYRFPTTAEDFPKKYGEIAENFAALVKEKRG